MKRLAVAINILIISLLIAVCAVMFASCGTDSAGDRSDPPSGECEHRWGNGYSSDGVVHYRLCTLCGQKKDEDYCTYKAPEKGQFNCETCGTRSVYADDVQIYKTLDLNYEWNGKYTFILKKDTGYEHFEFPESFGGRPIQIIRSDCETLKSVKVPGAIEEIVAMGSAVLEHAEIGYGVKKLGAIFKNCTHIKEFTIPNSVTELESTFKGCTALERVIIPDSVTILKGTFDGCTSLKEISIPDSVKSIWDVTFRGCTSLKSIKIPSSVEEFGYLGSLAGDSIFERCTSLIEAEFAEDCKIERLVYTFEGCTALKRVKLPGSVKVMEGTFRFCESLESIEIPDSVTTFSSWSDELSDLIIPMFRGCTSLKTVKLSSSLAVIPRETFKDCTSLESIEFPDSVVVIGWNAFKNCKSLREVTLPAHIQTIGSGAFYDSGLTVLNVPASAADTLKSVGISVFDGTPWYDGQEDGLLYLGRVLFSYKGEMTEPTFIDYIRDDTVSISSVFNKSNLNGKLSECIVGFVIPPSVEYLDGNFSRLTNLGSIILPSTLDIVSTNSFSESEITVYTDVQTMPDNWIYCVGDRVITRGNWAHIIYGCTLSDDKSYVVAITKTETCIEHRGSYENKPAKAPKRKGYVFLGWTTTEGSSQVDYTMDTFMQAPDGTVLYAVWTEED